MNKWTRRTFIGAGTVAGGGFLLGVAGLTFAPGRHALVSADAADKGQLTTWIGAVWILLCFPINLSRN
ncbi:MAG: hypothetical protein QM736_09825 [Vicinamibacterales bacterium]